MITGLDHILVLCPNISDGEAAYSRLLGREPDWRANDGAGADTVMYQMENSALELMAPTGMGPLSRRLHTLLDQQGAGLQSMILGCTDIDEVRTTLERRALKPEDVQAGESIDQGRVKVRAWRRFRIDDAASAGVRVFVLERRKDDPIGHQPAAPGAVSGLDHVVINTSNPDKSVSFYGARLGLRMALDRSNPDWDMRLIFFRVGGVTIELAHRLSKGVSAAPDRLWGLSWRVDDIELAHKRLADANLNPSDIRPGRRAGTQVFSLKDGTLGVPTLVLADDGA